jgi:hypothetical protein
LARIGLARCPECDSPDVRAVRTQGAREKLLALFGFYAFYCRDCCTRSVLRPLGPATAAYARCPRCCRMDLTTWDPRHYHPEFWMDLKAWLGGNRWRCEPCRRNFVSWRPRRSRYVRPSAEPAVESHAAPGGGGLQDS